MTEVPDDAPPASSVGSSLASSGGSSVGSSAARRDEGAGNTVMGDPHHEHRSEPEVQIRRDPYYVGPLPPERQEAGFTPQSPFSAHPRAQAYEVGSDPGMPRMPPPPPTKPAPSRWPLASILVALFLGPIGAVLAIGFGFYGRSEAERNRDVSGKRWATLGLVLGALLLPVWGVAVSFLVWTHVLQSDEPSFPPVVSKPSPRRPIEPTANVPPQGPPTRAEHQGRITVVDIGPGASSLPEALGRERAEAASANENLVLMTTARGCEPCRGVDVALPDPLMQGALAKVRLVRVDVRVFHDDLAALHVPDERIPGFFLLAVDLSPRDGIDGSEWDADIPANIAPVLGAFVRGKYKKRRNPWRPLPGSGVSL